MFSFLKEEEQYEISTVEIFTASTLHMKLLDYM